MSYEDTDFCCLDGKAMSQSRSIHVFVFVCWKCMAIKKTCNIGLYIEEHVIGFLYFLLKRYKGSEDISLQANQSDSVYLVPYAI